MLRQCVLSNMIRSIGWSNNILEIEFFDKSIYQCYNVTRSEFLALMHSPSKEAYLARIEKIHPFKRIQN